MFLECGSLLPLCFRRSLLRHATSSRGAATRAQLWLFPQAVKSCWGTFGDGLSFRCRLRDLYSPELLCQLSYASAYLFRKVSRQESNLRPFEVTVVIATSTNRFAGESSTAVPACAGGCSATELSRSLGSRNRTCDLPIRSNRCPRHRRNPSSLVLVENQLNFFIAVRESLARMKTGRLSSSCGRYFPRDLLHLL